MGELMNRFTPILIAVCLAVTGFAADAQGGVKRHYSHAYYSARNRCGEAPGRNVRREGGTLSNGRTVTAPTYRDLATRLDSMCRPQPKPRVVSQATSTHTSSPSVQPASTSSGGSLPSCTYVPESGGSYTAYNPSTGAYGKYQIIPSTAAVNHCDLSTASGQDQCAQRIMATQGRRAWVNC